MLGEFEQVVLLAVLQVGDGAYGVPVQREIAERTNRDAMLGSIYKTLERLEDKGLVTSHSGPPTPQRGGRRTRCYVVTAAGKRAIQHSIKTLRRMAAGLDVGLEAP